MMKNKENLEIVINQYKDQKEAVEDLNRKLNTYSGETFEQREKKALAKQLEPIIRVVDENRSSMTFPLELPSFSVETNVYNGDEYYQNNYYVEIRALTKKKERTELKKEVYSFSGLTAFLPVIFFFFTTLSSFAVDQLLLSLPHLLLFIGSFITMVCFWKWSLNNRNLMSKMSTTFQPQITYRADKNGYYLYLDELLTQTIVDTFIQEITDYFSVQTVKLEDEMLEKALELKQKKTTLCTWCRSEFNDEDVFCSKCGTKRGLKDGDQE